MLLNRHHARKLVSGALRRALATRLPPVGLVVPPGQGIRTGPPLRREDLTAPRGAPQSRSRRGNGCDNARAEPFGGRVKAEPLGGGFPGLAKTEASHRAALGNPAP